MAEGQLEPVFRGLLQGVDALLGLVARMAGEGRERWQAGGSADVGQARAAYGMTVSLGLEELVRDATRWEDGGHPALRPTGEAMPLTDRGEAPGERGAEDKGA